MYAATGRRWRDASVGVIAIVLQQDGCAARVLATCCGLAVISNIDDDLRTTTAPQLGVSYDNVATAPEIREGGQGRSGMAMHGLPLKRFTFLAISIAVALRRQT